MTTLVKWAPFQDLDVIERRMRRMLEDFGVAPVPLPAADLFETEKELVTTFYLHERLEKQFKRTFTLPAEADLEHVEAKFKTGVLEVHVPKIEQAKARKITIGA